MAIALPESRSVKIRLGTPYLGTLPPGARVRQQAESLRPMLTTPSVRYIWARGGRGRPP
jgi:hypothetical protein